MFSKSFKASYVIYRVTTFLFLPLLTFIGPFGAAFAWQTEVFWFYAFLGAMLALVYRHGFGLVGREWFARGGWMIAFLGGFVPAIGQVYPDALWYVLGFCALHAIAGGFFGVQVRKAIEAGLFKKIEGETFPEGVNISELIAAARNPSDEDKNDKDDTGGKPEEPQNASPR